MGNGKVTLIQKYVLSFESNNPDETNDTSISIWAGFVQDREKLQSLVPSRYCFMLIFCSSNLMSDCLYETQDRGDAKQNRRREMQDRYGEISDCLYAMQDRHSEMQDRYGEISDCLYAMQDRHSEMQGRDVETQDCAYAMQDRRMAMQDRDGETQDRGYAIQDHRKEMQDDDDPTFDYAENVPFFEVGALIPQKYLKNDVLKNNMF